MKYTHIFRNPFYIVYIFLRALIRTFVGRQSRNSILTRMGWENIESFLTSLNVSTQIIRTSIINRVHRHITERPFQHEPLVSSFLIHKKGNIFIDVGANFGYYSFLLHDNYKRIIAIEPHPLNLNILQELKQKHSCHRVTVLNVAVSDINGKAPLYLTDSPSSHTLLPNRQKTTKRKTITVQLKTLTSIIGNDNIDLVKVDVEGGEWKVLTGAEKALNQINSWLIELHDPSRKKELTQWFTERKHTYTWIDEKHIYATRTKAAN